MTDYGDWDYQNSQEINHSRFPGDAVLGQTHIHLSGKKYVWTGSRWELLIDSLYYNQLLLEKECGELYNTLARLHRWVLAHEGDCIYGGDHPVALAAKVINEYRGKYD